MAAGELLSNLPNMPPNSSAIRSSRSSQRYSPYSRSSAPASLHHSLPLPNQHHQFPLAGGYAASHASEVNLSPPSAYHQPSASSTLSHHSTNLPVPPSLRFQPIYEAPPLTSIHQLEGSTHQVYPFPLDQPPANYAQLSLLQGPYHPLPTTNIPYPNPIHLQQKSTVLHPARPSMATHPPGDSTYQNYSVRHQSLQVPQGQASAIPGPGHSYYNRYQSQGMFSGSHNLAFSGNMFVDHSVTSDNFMEKLLQHTIIGAEFDSSDRHPPPRCHPGTRLAIIKRCQVFIAQCDGKEKMRWVVGPAGVGKSATMQMVAEEAPADASVFFSVNGRQDGTKIFTTIAYQLAAKYEPYCQFIRNEINRDPSLLRKSLPTQFRKFIVDPFIHRQLFNTSHRHVIIIDGLDECDKPLMQRELLGLISYFCITYPTSPIAWIVASRPEPHITSFFDDVRVAPAYTKEEITIDSDEAWRDVQRYLRDELNEIKLTSPTLKHKREWPSELEFTRIATAAGGLFAYASTVIRYVGDTHCWNPIARLRHILEAIDGSPNDDVSRKDHPMAQLDALYRRILSNIPADVMTNARKLLLIIGEYKAAQVDFSWQRLPPVPFRQQCNILELSEDAAYGALHHLHAVVRVPTPEEADGSPLKYFHKSFEDFLFNFERSGFIHQADADNRCNQYSLRIVEQARDNSGDMDSGEEIECYEFGHLKAGPGFCDNISLSWPGDERYLITDDQLRLNLYRVAIADMCYRFGAPNSSRQSYEWCISCFPILTTCFTVHGPEYPIGQLLNFIFQEFRLTPAGGDKLMRVPLRTLDYAAIWSIVFRFTSPIGADVQCSDPWNPACTHSRDEVDGLQQWQGWLTIFDRFLSGPGDDAIHTDIPRFNLKAGKDHYWDYYGAESRMFTCLYCTRRFAYYFVNNPNQLATVFVDSTELCYVELEFVDPDDGISKWTYRFHHSGLPSCLD